MKHLVDVQEKFRVSAVGLVYFAETRDFFGVIDLVMELEDLADQWEDALSAEEVPPEWRNAVFYWKSRRDARLPADLADEDPVRS